MVISPQQAWTKTDEPSISAMWYVVMLSCGYTQGFPSEVIARQGHLSKLIARGDGPSTVVTVVAPTITTTWSFKRLAPVHQECFRHEQRIHKNELTFDTCSSFTARFSAQTCRLDSTEFRSSGDYSWSFGSKNAWVLGKLAFLHLASFREENPNFKLKLNGLKLTQTDHIWPCLEAVQRIPSSPDSPGNGDLPGWHRRQESGLTKSSWHRVIRTTGDFMIPRATHGQNMVMSNQ